MLKVVWISLIRLSKFESLSIISSKLGGVPVPMGGLGQVSELNYNVWQLKGLLGGRANSLPTHYPMAMLSPS